jgi:hypothetical protein
MSIINSPNYIINKHRKEAHESMIKENRKLEQEALEKIRNDLGRASLLNLNPDGLMSHRAAAWNFDYLKTCAADKDFGDDLIFLMMVRNREREDLEKAAEAVVDIFQKERFTVSEALLFMKHIEGIVMASPVNF